MKTLNIMVDNIGASHMAFYLIEQANRLSEKGEAQVTIYYDQLHRPCRRLLVPAMMMIEAWAQPGVTISTSLSTTARMLHFPGPTRKMFYVWDFMWMRNPKKVGPFTELFRKPELELIARCPEHAQILENNFNVEVPYVFDNFEHDALLQAISDDRTTK